MRIAQIGVKRGSPVTDRPEKPRLVERFAYVGIRPAGGRTRVADPVTEEGNGIGVEALFLRMTHPRSQPDAWIRIDLVICENRRKPLLLCGYELAKATSSLCGRSNDLNNTEFWSCRPLDEFTVQNSMSPFPLVSIIISNYNYERFVREAIESALNQTYSNIEVIVVDDGSTDSSPKIITSYGERVTAVLKKNAGQASACNAGFRASSGEIAIFLDSDDVLLPTTVKRFVKAFQSKPGIAKVQCRQRVVDASGRPTGEFQPPARQLMDTGDMRRQLIENNGYIWPSTSGNAFAASVVRRIMPVPEALYRGTPDIHLCNLSAVLGEVVSLEEPGTLYRVHGGNNYFDSVGVLDLRLLRDILLAVDDNHVRMKSLFAAQWTVPTHTIGPNNLWFLRGRMICARLDPQNHPFQETVWELFVRGCVLSARHPNPEISKGRRALYLLWFAAMLLGPRFLAKDLASVFPDDRRRRLYRALMNLTEIRRRQAPSAITREFDTPVNS